MKRQNIASIIIGGTIGFFPALLLFNSMPDSSDAQLIAGLGGLSAGPVVMMLIDAKKRSAYVAEKQGDWETARNALRHYPNNWRVREAALNSGKMYYACINKSLHKALANDLNILMG